MKPDIYIALDDLKEKFNHNFIYDIYENCKNYKICGLYCSNCMFKLYIYLAKNKYKFEKQLNFTYIIRIGELEYAYDAEVLTCEEQIIKNIIE